MLDSLQNLRYDKDASHEATRSHASVARIEPVTRFQQQQGAAVEAPRDVPVLGALQNLRYEDTPRARAKATETCLQALLHTSLYGDADDTASEDIVICSPFADGLALVEEMLPPQHAYRSRSSESRSRSRSRSRDSRRYKGERSRSRSRDRSASALHDLPLLKEINPYPRLQASGCGSHVFSTDIRADKRLVHTTRKSCKNNLDIIRETRLSPAKEKKKEKKTKVPPPPAAPPLDPDVDEFVPQVGMRVFDRQGVRRAMPRAYVYHTPRKAEKRVNAEKAAVEDCSFRPQINAGAEERKRLGAWWVGLAKRPKKEVQKEVVEETFPFQPNVNSSTRSPTRRAGPVASERLFSDFTARKRRRENDIRIKKELDEKKFKANHAKVMQHEKS